MNGLYKNLMAPRRARLLLAWIFAIALLLPGVGLRSAEASYRASNAASTASSATSCPAAARRRGNGRSGTSGTGGRRSRSADEAPRGSGTKSGDLKRGDEGSSAKGSRGSRSRRRGRGTKADPKQDAIVSTYDAVAGYIVEVDNANNTITLELSDGRTETVELARTAYEEAARPLGKPFQSPGKDALKKGRFIFVEGVRQERRRRDGKPQRRGRTGTARSDDIIHATRIRVPGRTGRRQNRQNPLEDGKWWVDQVASVADSYLEWQFPDGRIDFRNYRTHLGADGRKAGGVRQETATLSRLIYGLSTAYMLTGEKRFLQAAEEGSKYMAENMMEVDPKRGVAYWNHALDIKGSKATKVKTSQFDDDINAITAYEQIYALAGLVETYRLNRDPAIRKQIDMTIKLFRKYFRDDKGGGYFSHLDPETFDPRAKSLGKNRSRKNWNSVGDHAPAYLINLVLATGETKYMDMLLDTGDTIEDRFPEFDRSSMVQERFTEDWSPDRTWGWQQDGGVVGHNLKIAWNMMRLNHLRPQSGRGRKYKKLARKLGDAMPDVGMDQQRGGWFDVMARQADRKGKHEHAWHNNKTWWQQEQGILAYMILGGSTGNADYLRLARESTAFYQTFFPDHDLGGVHFSVGDDGRPVRSGMELPKGSHSMAGYHATELGFLGAVYQNLLISKKPLDLHFKPHLGGDNTLRVSPDALPPGRVRLEKVWVNGKEYKNFDAEAMTVRLPKPKGTSGGRGSGFRGHPHAQGEERVEVKVRLAPVD